MIILYLILTVIGSVGLGLLYNFLVIKNYPANKRKGAYVKTIVVFLICAVLLFGILQGRIIAGNSISNLADKLDQNIKEAQPNNLLVTQGLDLNAMNNDITKINAAVNEINKLLPSHTALGIPELLYNIILDSFSKQVQSRLAIIDFTAKKATNLADSDGILTITSIINSFKTSIIKVVNIIVIVLASIITILFAIYIIKSLSAATKEKNANVNVNAT